VLGPCTPWLGAASAIADAGREAQCPSPSPAAPLLSWM
jgi:hypothetical protein